MSLNKKASLETKEIIELILAGAGIFLIIFFLWNVFSPDFNKDKETAKSYLNTFKSVIDDVDEIGSARFSLWGGDPKMVYFGKAFRISSGDDVFSRPNTEENYLCFCYEKGKEENKRWICENCVSLKYPIEFSNSGEIFTEGWSFDITKRENKYFFEATYGGEIG